MVEYRNVMPEDVIEILLLEQSQFNETLTFHSEMLNCILFGELSFVALEDGIIVGIIKVEESLEDEGFMIAVLCVHTLFRRRRIAETLLQRSITAISHRIHVPTKVWLLTSVDNEPAKKLYRKFGFGHEAILRDVYFDRSSAVKLFTTLYPCQDVVIPQ